MRIGLIDVDGHNFPNIPLMKISAWHKAQGDQVEWYDPWTAWLSGDYDKVYMSKVFSFTHDYEHPIYAKEVHRGGADMPFALRTEGRFLETILSCRKRSNMSIQTIRYITSATRRMDS